MKRSETFRHSTLMAPSHNETAVFTLLSTTMDYYFRSFNAENISEVDKIVWICVYTGGENCYEWSKLSFFYRFKTLFC